MSAAFDKKDLTASEVLTRVYGFGILDADRALDEVSEQDRSAIIEAYEADDCSRINTILEKSREKAE